ncbi:MAG TPA: transposase [Myxococcales bacterium]
MLLRAFREAVDRNRMRIAHYSIQGNHLHLVVEADDGSALSRGMQGLAVRIARRLNAHLGRRGAVFADRYHAHVLESRRAGRQRRALRRRQLPAPHAGMAAAGLAR